jgi:uncharacterized Tic20 family protein
MSVSATKPGAEDRKLAIAAETLYLVNLMLLPGLAFTALLILYVMHYRSAGALARNHLSQTVGVSVLGGSLIVLVGITYWLMGGFGPWAWVWAVFYFTFIHSSLIFMGVFGFVKASNDQTFIYPVIGRLFPA